MIYHTIPPLIGSSNTQSFAIPSQPPLLITSTPTLHHHHHHHHAVPEQQQGTHLTSIIPVTAQKLVSPSTNSQIMAATLQSSPSNPYYHHGSHHHVHSPVSSSTLSHNTPQSAVARVTLAPPEQPSIVSASGGQQTSQHLMPNSHIPHQYTTTTADTCYGDDPKGTAKSYGNLFCCIDRSDWFEFF